MLGLSRFVNFANQELCTVHICRGRDHEWTRLFVEVKNNGSNRWSVSDSARGQLTHVVICERVVEAHVGQSLTDVVHVQIVLLGLYLGQLEESVSGHFLLFKLDRFFKSVRNQVI